MKKFKKFLDKKKKISSVSEEERFMYEVCTVSGIENTMQACILHRLIQLKLDTMHA